MQKTSDFDASRVLDHILGAPGSDSRLSWRLQAQRRAENGLATYIVTAYVVLTLHDKLKLANVIRFWRFKGPVHSPRIRIRPQLAPTGARATKSGCQRLTFCKFWWKTLFLFCSSLERRIAIISDFQPHSNIT